MKYLILALLSVLVYMHSSVGNPLHISIAELKKHYNQSLTFNLQLPNNDIVEVGLSFRLLTQSVYSAVTTTVAPTTVGQSTDTTTSTTVGNDYQDGDMQKDMENLHPTSKFITVEEAIESFRKDLIKKEIDIAGIIESKEIFYRHFKLEFNSNKSITIRCTYDSDYEMRTLRITCYEYHEFESERILSNGEVEYFTQYDESHKPSVEVIKADSIKQTYHMVVE